jgi:hypothetical protein
MKPEAGSELDSNTTPEKIIHSSARHIVKSIQRPVPENQKAENNQNCARKE